MTCQELLNFDVNADDAKIYIEINDVDDFEDIQDDLFKLCRRTTNWLLFFHLKM